MNHCKCGKPATHIVPKTDEKCCSKCGIGKMIKGELLEQYIAPVSILISKPESKVYAKKSIPEVDKFLKSLEEEKLNI